MNKIAKVNFLFLLQAVLFAALLYCAVWPIRIFLLLVALICLFLPLSFRKYWLWSSILVTAYVFFFFSPLVMDAFAYVKREVNLLMVSPPEIVRKSKIENPVVSIVIPAYNYEQYVGKAVETAAMQKFELPYEVVVVDDGSSDATLERILDVARKYPHVAVYHNIRNCGLITTKNAGISLARGEWIYNLDADDYISPDTLATLFSLTSKDDGGDFVFSADVILGKEKNINYYCHGRNFLDYNCVTNRALFRKSDWQKLGPYDYLFQNGLEDWDFAMAFKRANRKIVMAERPVYYALVKEISRNVEADKHILDLWWYMQAKYANMLTLKQRMEIVFCGFYRFYRKDVIEKRFSRYNNLYEIVY